ncbi:MAG TPA: DUF1003 domain-containing protein [Xanthobacteraceae bacterium]|nr:DUF1003 domain-containing protein [Xanthobacteraceae bacterium]
MAHHSVPTATPSPPRRHDPGRNSLVGRNIRALKYKRDEAAANAGVQDGVAAVITRFAGSMTLVALHVVLVAVWIAINLGWIPTVAPFDPTFVILATVASVEAIFLSTFVLITQNRAAEAADRRDVSICRSTCWRSTRSRAY